MDGWMDGVRDGIATTKENKNAENTYSFAIFGMNIPDGRC